MADVNAACAAVVKPIVVLFNVPWLETIFEKVPFLGVVPPTVTLSKVPTARGLIVSVPLACGLIVTSAFGVKFTFPDVVNCAVLMFMLLMVPVVSGLIVIRPVPVGFISLFALTPFCNKFPVFKILLNTPTPITDGCVTVTVPNGFPSLSP